MFTLLASDDDEEEYEITEPIEIAELLCSLMMTALEFGLDADDLRAILDAAVERQGSEVN